MPVKSGPGDIDESSDTFDTIDWLVKNVPGNNGRVGIWGISYPGFYAAAGLIDSHPALKAVSPQAPLVDYFLGDDTHHNGAFFLHQEFNFDAVFGLPRPEPTRKSNPRFDHGSSDAYDFFLRMGPLSGANELHLKGKRAFWNDIMKHGNYDDFWKERALLPHLKGVKPAVMIVGGWFDAEDLYGPLNIYRTIEKTSPAAKNMLVMNFPAGAVGPRRLGSGRRCLARAGLVLGEDGRVLPGGDPATILRAPPQRERRVESARGVGLRDGAERVAPARPLAPEPGPAEISLPRCRGWVGVRGLRAGRRARRSTSSSATRPARSLTPPRSRSIARTHTWSRTSGSQPGGPTSWSTRPDPSPRTRRSSARSGPSCKSRRRGPTPTG